MKTFLENVSNDMSFRQAIRTYKKDKDSKALESIWFSQNIIREVNWNISRLHKVYGATELTQHGYEIEDIEADCFMGFVKALERFNYDNSIDEKQNAKKFLTCVNLNMSSSIKRAVEELNGVSEYYCARLMNIKKAGLDLYDSPDDELAELFSDYKDPYKLIDKLRLIFDATKTVSFDEVTSYSIYGINDESSYKTEEALLEEIRALLPTKKHAVILNGMLNNSSRLAIRTKLGLSKHIYDKLRCEVEEIVKDVCGAESKIVHENYLSVKA